MARRCLCDLLLDALTSNPSLRTLPMAARLLWLELGRAALALQDRRIPFGSVSRVSLWVSAPEPEVETQLETLLREGLLVRDGEGLRVPLLDQAVDSPRAKASRINGSKGGRPLKNRGAPGAQREMILPIQGGAAAAGKTQGNLGSAPSCAREGEVKKKDSSSPSFSSSALREAREAASPEAKAVAAELARLFGIGFPQPEIAQEWMDAGWSGELIRRVATAFAQQEGRPAVTSIRYLERQIAQQAAAEAPRPQASAEDLEYLRELQDWRAGGCLGPRPVRQARAA